jgi:hypothetical protein
VSTNETPVAAWRRWLETLLMAALGLAAYAAYRAHDPADSGLSAGWLVLLPVLAGAQHGTLYGCASALVLCAVGLQALALQAPPLAELGAAIAQGWGVVYAAVGAIAGFFRDLDERRHVLLSKRARDSAQELQTLERAFACLQWSHAQLEQQFCTQPYSLASILDAAAERMQELRSSAALADLMLEVVASRTRVEAASMYALGPRNQLGTVALASLGAAAQLDVAGHPLVQRALRSSGLVSIVDAPTRAQAQKGVLAAVALHSSCSQLRLMFVVHQLPFEAFCVDELRNLHVLLARLVDLAQQRIDALEEAETVGAQSDGRAPLATNPWSAAEGGTRQTPDPRRASSRRAQLR